MLRLDSVTGYEVFLMELAPDLIHSVLICLFTTAFVCDEFSNRTFGMNLLCGFPRWEVFWAKAMAFYAGLLPLILSPVVVAAAITTVGNQFGLVWEGSLVFYVVFRLLCYIFRYLFLGGFALLTASLVRDRIGTFGLGLAGMCILMSVVVNHLETLDTSGVFIIVSLFGTIALSAVAALIFARRDLR